MSRIWAFIRSGMHFEWMRSFLEQWGLWPLLSSFAGAIIIALWDAVSGLGGPATMALVTFVSIYVLSICASIRSRFLDDGLPHSTFDSLGDISITPLQTDETRELLHFHRRFAEPTINAVRDVIYALHRDARLDSVEEMVRDLFIESTYGIDFSGTSGTPITSQWEMGELLRKYIQATERVLALARLYSIDLAELPEFDELKQRDGEYTNALRDLIARPEFSDFHASASFDLHRHQRQRRRWP